jgi:hypothetical protein
MQVLNVTNLPIFLGNDRADPPFGDPISGVTCTSAAPGIVTVPGYNAPVAGDAVSLTFTAGGSIPTGLVAGQTYYVVAPIVNNTFAVSATKGGGAITTSSTGSQLTVHLLSFQVDGSLVPFKSGATVVVLNMTGGSLVLQSAPDANTGVVGNPSGPGAFTAIATIPTLSAALVTLNNDWIRVSTAATLILLQN